MEATSKTLGHKISHVVWTARMAKYLHDSVDRTHTLRDCPRHLKKGTSTVIEFAHKFKGICDQLAVIGHPLDDYDKYHWFLCRLGSSFETFSTTQWLLTPRPKFHNLVSQAESYEMFLKPVNNSTISLVSFNTTLTYNPSNNTSTIGHDRSSSHWRGQGHGARRSLCCQLCQKDCYYVRQCPDL